MLADTHRCRESSCAVTVLVATRILSPDVATPAARKTRPREFIRKADRPDRPSTKEDDVENDLRRTATTRCERNEVVRRRQRDDERGSARGSRRGRMELLDSSVQYARPSVSHSLCDM